MLAALFPTAYRLPTSLVLGNIVVLYCAVLLDILLTQYLLLFIRYSILGYCVLDGQPLNIVDIHFCSLRNSTD